MNGGEGSKIRDIMRFIFRFFVVISVSRVYRGLRIGIVAEQPWAAIPIRGSVYSVWAFG